MKIENHFETYREDIDAYLKSLTDEKEDCYIPEYLRKEIAVYCANRTAPIISGMIYEHDREQIALLKAKNDELKYHKLIQEAMSRIVFPEKTETFFDNLRELERAERCQCDGIREPSDDAEPEPEPDNRPACCKDHDVYGATCDTCEFGYGEPELKTVLNIVDTHHTYLRAASAKELKANLLKCGIVTKYTHGINRTVVTSDHVKIVVVNKTDLEHMSKGDLYDEAFFRNVQPASRDYLKDRDKKRFKGTLFEYILKQEGK